MDDLRVPILYYTMYIVHRSGGAVLNLVETSKSKAINGIKNGQNYYNMHTSSPKNSIKRSQFSAKFGWDESQPSPSVPSDLPF